MQEDEDVARRLATLEAEILVLDVQSGSPYLQVDTQREAISNILNSSDGSELKESKAKKLINDFEKSLNEFWDQALDSFNEKLKALQELELKVRDKIAVQHARRQAELRKSASGAPKQGASNPRSKGANRKKREARAKVASKQAAKANESIVKIQGVESKKRADQVHKPHRPGPFMSNFRLLEQVEQQYKLNRQKQKSEDQQQISKILESRMGTISLFATQLALPADIKRVLTQSIDITTLAGSSQLEARLQHRELEQKLRNEQDTKATNEQDRSLECWYWLGTLAQRMEALKNIHGTSLPADIANQIRDMFFYHDDVEKIPVQRLKRTSDNLSTYINDTKEKPRYFKSYQDLLRAADPATDPRDTCVLLDLFEKRVTLTPEFCKSRIEKGIKLFAQFEEIYKISQGACNRELLIMALGFAVAMIGNFASHLEKMQSAQYLLESRGKLIQIKLTIKNCKRIGVLYRHLDKFKEGTKPALTWRDEVQKIIEGFNLKQSKETMPIALQVQAAKPFLPSAVPSHPTKGSDAKLQDVVNIPQGNGTISIDR